MTAYAVPVPRRLREHQSTIAAEYRAGKSFDDLAARWHCGKCSIGAVLIAEGCQSRPQKKRTPSQARNAAESRANGDAAVRARWTPRRPCPWGVTCKDEPSKPLPCTLATDGCDPVACVGSRMAEGRVSVASSFGREAVVLGGMR